MDYLEDPDFWNSIKDNRVFDEDSEGNQMREYWNWYHEHSDDGHTWEEGAGDWQDDCWYEKHDLKFKTWGLDEDCSNWEEDNLEINLWYDPCNKWIYP